MKNLLNFITELANAVVRRIQLTKTLFFCTFKIFVRKSLPVSLNKKPINNNRKQYTSLNLAFFSTLSKTFFMFLVVKMLAKRTVFAFKNFINYFFFFFNVVFFLFSSNWKTFKMFFLNSFMDNLIELVYYFFPPERYHDSLNEDDEEEIFLVTLPKEKKEFFENLVLNIKLGLGSTFALKKLLRFNHAVGLLPKEQKNLLKRFIKLNTAVLTPTGYALNSTPRLFGNFYHVNRRMVVLQQLFDLFWSSVSWELKKNNNFLKTTNNNFSYFAPLPKSVLWQTSLVAIFRCFFYFFCLSFAFFFKSIFFFLFCLFPFPFFWAFFSYFEKLVDQYLKHPSLSFLTYSLLTPVHPFPLFSSFKRWFEWHFFFTFVDVDTELDQWSVEASVDFEPTKTFSDLEFDVNRDAALLFDDAWPEFTATDVDSDEREEDFMEEVEFEQDQKYSSSSADSETEKKIERPWKPDEEKEENWLPWGDWVFFKKTFPEDDFISALTLFLLILIGGFFYSFDQLDLLQVVSDYVYSYYSYFITQVNSWKIVGELEWPWVADWDYYGLKAIWGGLDQVSWQSWSLTTDQELRLFDIHQFNNKFFILEYKPVILACSDPVMFLKDSFISTLSDKSFFYSFLPGDTDLYCLLLDTIAIVQKPGFFVLDLYSYNQDEKTHYCQSIAHLPYVMRFFGIIFYEWKFFLKDFWSWFLNWNAPENTQHIDFVPSWEYLHETTSLISTKLNPHYAQNFTWKTTDSDTFMYFGLSWREFESTYVHEWAQENQYWDYSLFWKTHNYQLINKHQYPMLLDSSFAEMPNDVRLRSLISLRQELGDFDFQPYEVNLYQAKLNEELRDAFLPHLLDKRNFIKMYYRHLFPSGDIWSQSNTVRFVKPQNVLLWQSYNNIPPPLRFDIFDSPVVWPWHLSKNQLVGWKFDKDWDRLWDTNLHWYWGGSSPNDKSFFSKFYGGELHLALPVLFNNFDESGNSIVHLTETEAADRKFFHFIQMRDPRVLDYLMKKSQLKVGKRYYYQELMNKLFAQYFERLPTITEDQDREIDKVFAKVLLTSSKKSSSAVHLTEIMAGETDYWGTHMLSERPPMALQIPYIERTYTRLFSAFGIEVQRLKELLRPLTRITPIRDPLMFHQNELYWCGRTNYYKNYLYKLWNKKEVYDINYLPTRFDFTSDFDNPEDLVRRDRQLGWKLLREFSFLDDQFPKYFSKSLPQLTSSSVEFFNYADAELVQKHYFTDTSVLPFSFVWSSASGVSPAEDHFYKATLEWAAKEHNKTTDPIVYYFDVNAWANNPNMNSYKAKLHMELRNAFFDVPRIYGEWQILSLSEALDWGLVENTKIKYKIPIYEWPDFSIDADAKRFAEANDALCCHSINESVMGQAGQVYLSWIRDMGTQESATVSENNSALFKSDLFDIDCDMDIAKKDKQLWVMPTFSSISLYPTSFSSRWADLCSQDFWNAGTADEDDGEGEDSDTPFENFLSFELDDEDDEPEEHIPDHWSEFDNELLRRELEWQDRIENGFLKNSLDTVLPNVDRRYLNLEDEMNHDDFFLENQSARRQDILDYFSFHTHLSELRGEIGDEDEEMAYYEGDDEDTFQFSHWHLPDWNLLTWQELRNLPDILKTKGVLGFFANVTDDKGGIGFWPNERLWWSHNYQSRDNLGVFFGSNFWANLFDLSNWNQHLFVNRQSPNFNYVRPQAILLDLYDGWSFQVEATDLDCYWTNMGCASRAPGRQVPHGDENLYLMHWYKDPLTYVSPYAYPDYNNDYLPSWKTYAKYPATRMWGWSISPYEPLADKLNFPVWGQWNTGRHTDGWWQYNKWGVSWWVVTENLFDRSFVNETPEFWSYRSLDFEKSLSSSSSFFKMVSPRPFVSGTNSRYLPVQNSELFNYWNQNLGADISYEHTFFATHFPKLWTNLYLKDESYLLTKSMTTNFARPDSILFSHGKSSLFFKRPENDISWLKNDFFNPLEILRPVKSEVVFASENAKQLSSLLPYRPSWADRQEALRLLRLQTNQSLWNWNPWTDGLTNLNALETVRFEANFKDFYSHPRPYYTQFLEWKLNQGFTFQKMPDNSLRPIKGLFFDDFADNGTSESPLPLSSSELVEKLKALKATKQEKTDDESLSAQEQWEKLMDSRAELESKYPSKNKN